MTLHGSTLPRIWTPPLRELEPRSSATEARTLGYDAIDFAHDVIGLRLYPWQEWLLIHSLELRPEGGFRFRKIVLLVGRQNGKSTFCQLLSLFFLYALGTNLVLGTAQDLDTAEEVWDGALAIIEETPELAALTDKPILAAGKKAIRLKTGERYKIKAANRRAGRGLSGDLVLLDELREHQNWDAWAAITGTTNARDNAQIWALSNAGDATSVVLRHLRKMGHLALGDPDGINADGVTVISEDEDQAPDEVEADDSLGIFEWSATPGIDKQNRAGWVASNPSLGYGAVTERTLRSDASTNPEWVFRTEVLCQWSDGTLEGPFPPGSWDDGQDKDSSIVDGSVPGFCLDVSWDRTTTYIAAAGDRADGLAHVELVAQRAGTEWVVGWFTDPEFPQRRGYRVAIQPGSPAGSLIDELTAAHVEVVEWKGVDLGGACGQLYDAVRDGRLMHRPQPALDVSAATAVSRPLRDGAWAWDRRKSPVDAAPLVAVTGALWLAGTHKPQAPSAYESNDLIVV